MGRRAAKPKVRYLSAGQVATMLGMHIKTFHRYLREGRLTGFPIQRGITCHWRWLESEVEDWLAKRPIVGHSARCDRKTAPAKASARR